MKVKVKVTGGVKPVSRTDLRQMPSTQDNSSCSSRTPGFESRLHFPPRSREDSNCMRLLSGRDRAPIKTFAQGLAEPSRVSQGCHQLQLSEPHSRANRGEQKANPRGRDSETRTRRSRHQLRRS